MFPEDVWFSVIIPYFAQPDSCDHAHDLASLRATSRTMLRLVSNNGWFPCQRPHATGHRFCQVHEPHKIKFHNIIINLHSRTSRRYTFSSVLERQRFWKFVLSSDVPRGIYIRCCFDDNSVSSIMRHVPEMVLDDENMEEVPLSGYDMDRNV